MKAYELLDSREKWCQGYTALDKQGNVVWSASEDACAYCIVGAVLRCYPRDQQSTTFDKLSNVLQRGASTWNDAPERTWEEVHALLKRLDI